MVIVWLALYAVLLSVAMLGCRYNAWFAVNSTYPNIYSKPVPHAAKARRATAWLFGAMFLLFVGGGVTYALLAGSMWFAVIAAVAAVVWAVFMTLTYRYRRQRRGY
jgi:hypothetical protein